MLVSKAFHNIDILLRDLLLVLLLVFVTSGCHNNRVIDDWNEVLWQLLVTKTNSNTCQR